MTYTPEQKLVDAYGEKHCPSPYGNHPIGCPADLDAMRLIRAIKALAWEEGAESAFYEPEIRGQVDYPDNPYKEQA